MRVGMLLLLCWIFPVNAWADEQRLQLLHEVRTRSHLLCSSALLYFNPAINSPDPRVLASSYDSLNLLATRSVQLEQPAALAAAQRDMQRLLRTLERIPRQSAEQYPELLMQLLQLYRQVDGWADDQLLQQDEASSAVARALRQQSVDMARLLLDYQARTYPFPEGGYQRLDMDRLQELDRGIIERFELLTELYAEQGESLAAAHRNYRFVRARFLSSTIQRPSGGIEFYLARGIIDIDELAAQAATTD